MLSWLSGHHGRHTHHGRHCCHGHDYHFSNSRHVHHGLHGYHSHQDRQETQDNQDERERQERQIWHLNLNFQVTCVGQLSQFLRCLVRRISHHIKRKVDKCFLHLELFPWSKNFFQRSLDIKIKNSTSMLFFIDENINPTLTDAFVFKNNTILN